VMWCSIGSCIGKLCWSRPNIQIHSKYLVAHRIFHRLGYVTAIPRLHIGNGN
jgi:hypothetical protein